MWMNDKTISVGCKIEQSKKTIISTLDIVEKLKKTKPGSFIFFYLFPLKFSNDFC